MPNTGLKIYTKLEEYYLDTGLPTGNTKDNVPADPDYVAPTTDLTFCPLNQVYYNTSQWRNFFRTNCGSGYEAQPIEYRVPDNAFSSSVSLAEANSLAVAHIDQYGQQVVNGTITPPAYMISSVANTNTVGVCTLIRHVSISSAEYDGYGNAAIIFKRNDSPATGIEIFYVLTKVENGDEVGSYSAIIPAGEFTASRAHPISAGIEYGMYINSVDDPAYTYDSSATISGTPYILE